MEQATVTYDAERVRLEQRLLDMEKALQGEIDRQAEEITRLRSLLTAVGVLAAECGRGA